MRYYIMVAAFFAVSCIGYADAQVVVKPGSSTNTVYVRVNQQAPVKEVPAIKVKLPLIDLSLKPYPSVQVRRAWVMLNEENNNVNLVNHLMTHPNHKGKFTRNYLEYLASLPDGNKRLRALHSDDHENAVRWDYLPSRPVSSYRTYTQPQCLNGRCNKPR